MLYGELIDNYIDITDENRKEIMRLLDHLSLKLYNHYRVLLNYLLETYKNENVQ